MTVVRISDEVTSERYDMYQLLGKLSKFVYNKPKIVTLCDTVGSLVTWLQGRETNFCLNCTVPELRVLF